MRDTPGAPSGTREGRTWTSRGVRFDAPLVVAEFPPEVPFGFLGRLLPTSESGELRLTLRQVPSSTALDLAERAVAVAQAELASRENAAGARPSQLAIEAEGAQELASRIAAREQELWRLGISFHSVGTGRLSAERARSRLAQRLRRLGFASRVPTFEAGLLRGPGELELEPKPSGFWHTLGTDAVAAFFPFVDESVHETGGILVGLLLEDANPVFLDRWMHASFSWGIFGATGSGKSFAAALFALRTRWLRPETEIFLLDPLGEFRELTRVLGGEAVALGPEGPGRLNPLDPVSTGGDRDAKAGRVGTMLRALFPSLTDEEAALLDGSLGRLFREGPEIPTWSDLLHELERRTVAGRLPLLLEVFRSGSLRYLDGPTTLSLSGSPLALDLSRIPPEQLPFHLAYALDALTTRIRANDRPKLLVIDEAHYLVRHPGTAAFLDQLVRHVRHFRTGVLILSQNPDDFLGTEAGRSLLRNLRATLLLRLAEVSPAAREFYALTDAETEWLPRARLPQESGYSEGLLRFGSSHLPLALIATTPEYEFLTERLAAAEKARPASGDSPRAARL